MLKIGEFSKLSHLTVKALRFYEKEGILMPASIDEWTGYRYYQTSQLLTASRIKAYRQLDLTLDEIRSILSGNNATEILQKKAQSLLAEQEQIHVRLSIIHSILEDKKMTYQVTEKIVAEQIVYTAETVLKNYSDVMEWVPAIGAECLALNPDIKCAEPPYEFCEYLDGKFKKNNVKVRHSEAVTTMGKGNEHIKFRVLPATKVLSIFHKGPYENLGESYSYILKYAEQNGYKVKDFPRECYIDGIWNKETPDEWLTEIQLPIED